MKSKIVSKSSIFNTLNVGASTPLSILNNRFNPTTDYVELHIANESGNLIKSHLDYQRYNLTKSTGFVDGSFQSIDHSPIDDLLYYGYVSGTYTLYYNFFRKIFSSSLEKFFFIKEISPSRKELRLSSNNLTNDEIQLNFNRIQTKLQTLDYVYNLVLNSGANVISQVINVSLDTSENNYSVLVKLDDPLDISITQNSMCWVLESVALSTQYVIDLVNEIEIDDSVKIQGANFNIEVDESNSYTTTYVSSSDLNPVNPFGALNILGFNASFSDAFENILTQTFHYQQLFGQYLENNSSARINVDYTKFKEYIHFSSAEDRLNNFIVKIKQIEVLDDTLRTLRELPDGTRVRLDVDKVVKEKLDIIRLFDGFEYFMYFDFSEYAYPKTDTDLPVVLYKTTDAQFLIWYNNRLNEAIEYDRNNPDHIWKLLPLYITNDTDNANLKLFINGLGHYYDNIWICIKSLENIYNNTNSAKTGISKDIVKDMLVSFGIKLYNSSEEVSIEQDLIGNNSGSLNIDNFDIISNQEYNKEIYKRIYHNLPVLLKSKGTEKSIRTLLSIFGIPNEVLDVDTKWSSFPSNTSTLINKIKYVTNVGNTGRVGVPITDPTTNSIPKSIEFTVKVSDSGHILMTYHNRLRILFTANSIYQGEGADAVDFEIFYSGGSYGLQGLDRSSDNVYKFIIQLETNDLDDTYMQIYVITKEYTEKTEPIEYTLSDWQFLCETELQLGDITSDHIVQYTNFRMYENPLMGDVLQAHIENFDTLITNDPGDLVCNLPLGSDNKFPKFYLSGQAFDTNPNYSIVRSYYDVNNTNYIPFNNIGAVPDSFIYAYIKNAINGLDRAYYLVQEPITFNNPNIDAVSLLYSELNIKSKSKNVVTVNQVDSVKDNLLSANVRNDEYDTQASVLNVSLSRGKDLNKSMIDYFYGQDINSNFGNPADMYLDEYSGVVKLRKDYFTDNKIEYTYANYTDLAGYINSSLFKMIHDFAPVGTNVITGVSVEPALTDRSKYRYIRSLNALDAIIEIEIGGIVVDGAYVDSFDVVFDQTGMYLSVGNNKFINKQVIDLDEFNRSYDNVLYGNIHKNTVYKYGTNNNNGFRLYKITNPGFWDLWTDVTTYPSNKPTLVEIPGGRTKYVCSSTYPTQPGVRVILGVPSEPLEFEVVNRYNCAMVEPEPTPPNETEFQEYNVDLKSFTLPRYEGSKVTSKNINVWTDGDSSYGKTAAIDSFVNHTALFTRIYSGSIGNQYNNVTVKYLVDSKGNLTELNELNRNVFDIQNILKQNDSCTVSLFDPLLYGNQKSTNGIKNIFSSGYFYKPLIYMDGSDDEVEFIKETDSQLSRFNAENVGGFINNYSANSEPVKYPSFISGNEYYVYNIFDKITYNSYNSFTSGSISAKTFPSYDIIDSSVSYQFKAQMGLLVGFKPENLKTQTQYKLDIVTNTGGDQLFSDRILASQLITLQPEYTLQAATQLEGTQVKRGWYIGLQIIIDYPIYDRLTNITVPKGIYNNYRIDSEEFIADEMSPYYKDGWYYFVVYNNNWYCTGRQDRRNNSVVDNRNYLNLSTLSTRPLTLSTQVLTDLNVGDSVYFRFSRLDSNPIIADFIGTGGQLTVEVEASNTLQTDSNIIHEVVNGNQIIFSSGFSKYYRYTQSSQNEVLIDKYGVIDDPFIVVPNDIISISHPDSTKSYLYNVVSAIVNADGLLVITVDKSVAINIINEPNNLSEFVLFKRVLDETNIVLQFNKREGDTSSGLLIPKNINPEYMSNIDTITRQIKTKLLEQN